VKGRVGRVLPKQKFATIPLFFSQYSYMIINRHSQERGREL